MKFELDHRTGMMQPKKNEEIYFAQSQGGGLIVDDKKNNIKYIIERDERITKLFGGFDKDNLNLYDMRDARIIADRVRRLLGRDHKYTDFHYFLRGYRMSEGVIKTCSDFLEESIWSDIQDRSMGKTVRKEDIITTNEDLKNKILELYIEQGEGETLDVSSLTNCIQCDDFSDIFKYFYKVKHIIGLEDWDVSHVEDMDGMFMGCKNFNSDLSKWNVSNVEDMGFMFLSCDNFNSDGKSLNNWDVSNVQDMGYMFQDCYNFNSDLSKWNVSNGIDMGCMFTGCKSLQQIPSWYMKKQSKITESIWSDIQDRSMGKTRRKEDGVKVHTCIDVDIYLKNNFDSNYDDIIKGILNYNDSYVDYRVGILSVRDKAYSTEEMANMRTFEAPYSYLIYDGRYGTSLVAEFLTYDEMKDFGPDDFEDRICEEDYISICKGVATKLKEVGDSIEYLPRDISYIGNKKNNMNYDGDYALQLIGESDVNNWEVEYVDKYGKGSTSTSLEDFKEDMIYAFPELDDVEFITWSYNKYACNIGIPITATTVKNFKKYKEYTKNWFTIDEEAE